VYNWSVNLYPDANGGYFRSLNPSVDIRPSSNIKLTLIPGISQTRNTIQYVKTVTDPLATSTFGARYVFADLHQTTLSATTRVTWTLTPMLSFELFAQPFTSSGDYKDFKELLEPKTLNYRVFGKDGSTIKPVSGSGKSVASYEVDSDGNGTAAPFSISNPDFSVQSLRGNAVVRWEYRPGSALFFVWQQQRSGFDQYNGEFRAGSNLRDIFSQPSNVFLVKATYWFAR
jgi:hypothetical protein